MSTLPVGSRIVWIAGRLSFARPLRVIVRGAPSQAPTTSGGPPPAAGARGGGASPGAEEPARLARCRAAVPRRSAPHRRVLGRVLRAEQLRLERPQRRSAMPLPGRARARRRAPAAERRGSRGRRGRRTTARRPRRAPGLLVTSRTIHVDLLRQAETSVVRSRTGIHRIGDAPPTPASSPRTPRAGGRARRGCASIGRAVRGPPRTADRTVPTVQGLEFAYALYALPPGRLPFRRWRWELWHGPTLVASGWRLARPDAGARAARARRGVRLPAVRPPRAAARRARPGARTCGPAPRSAS